MNEITVLLLGHKSLVGKDLFYSYAKEKEFVRVAFADKLKETVADLYNFSYEQMHGDYKDVEDMRYPNLIDSPTIYKMTSLGEGIRGVGPAVEIPNPDYKPFLTPRRVLQLFGQQQRALFPDIWAAYIFNAKIPELVRQGCNKFIVTDFRFKNEAKVAINWATDNSNAKLHLVKINRNILARSGAGDISENDLNDFSLWNHVIDNNGSKEEFKQKTFDLISSL